MQWGGDLLKPGSGSVFIRVLQLLSMGTKTPQRDLLFSKLMNIQPWILLFYIHTTVSLVIVASLLSSLIFVSISKVDFFNNKFLMQGYNNMRYLFSLWVLGVETVCFGMYSALDLIRIYGKQSQKSLEIKNILRNVANHILFSLVFPLSLVVMVLFWGFYFWNRELIYPVIMNDLFPPFLNHVMHTCPTPISMLYMFTDIETEPPRWNTLTLLAMFMTVYSLVFLGVSKTKGVWIYPVLEALTTSQTTCVLTSALIGTFIILTCLID